VSLVSYQHFTVKKVMDLLGYDVKETPFLGSLGFVSQAPSEALLGAVGLLRKALVFHSEKSRSEALVAPVLSEAAVRSGTRLFSGESFDIDTESGLVGLVDFLFAREAPGVTIVEPVLCIVEAKKADIDTHALGQCIATMIAAQRYNESADTVYGCVTTGNDWQFLRLSGKRVDVDPTFYYEKELPAILGILLHFLRHTEVAQERG
jgi:hypothetical protein